LNLLLSLNGGSFLLKLFMSLRILQSIKSFLRGPGINAVLFVSRARVGAHMRLRTPVLLDFFLNPLNEGWLQLVSVVIESSRTGEDPLLETLRGRDFSSLIGLLVRNILLESDESVDNCDLLAINLVIDSVSQRLS